MEAVNGHAPQQTVNVHQLVIERKEDGSGDDDT